MLDPLSQQLDTIDVHYMAHVEDLAPVHLAFQGGWLREARELFDAYGDVEIGL